MFSDTLIFIFFSGGKLFSKKFFPHPPFKNFRPHPSRGVLQKGSSLLVNPRHPGLGVRAQDLQERARPYELGYGLPYPFFFYMPVEVREEYILPSPGLHGPRLYLGEVYAPAGKGLEHLVKGPGGVLYGEDQRGLVLSRPLCLVPAYNEEPRVVVGGVLYVLFEDPQVVDVRRRRACHGRHRRVLGGALGGWGRWGYVEEDGIRGGRL